MLLPRTVRRWEGEGEGTPAHYSLGASIPPASMLVSTGEGEDRPAAPRVIRGGSQSRWPGLLCLFAA